jgi:hypothetical protein
MRRKRTLRTWQAVALAGLLAGWAGVAQAALSDRLCAPSGGTLSAYPTGGELTAAAAMVEQRLARRGGADPYADVQPAWTCPLPTRRAPRRRAIAEYCVAAGELMRVSAQGSQLQAQSYLLSAFQTASAANLLKPASLAAYRLGLVSLSGSTASGTPRRLARRPHPRPHRDGAGGRGGDRRRAVRRAALDRGAGEHQPAPVDRLAGVLGAGGAGGQRPAHRRARGTEAGAAAPVDRRVQRRRGRRPARPGLDGGQRMA